MCPGFICQWGLRKRYRKGLPWGTCECNMTRSRICMTHDRQRKTLVKRVFPNILLETLISCFVLLHNAQALAFPIRDADLRPPTVRASQRKSCFARHLVPPCAHACLAAVVKHQESFPSQVLVQWVILLPETPWGQFEEETPCADLGTSGAGDAPRLSQWVRGGDEHEADDRILIGFNGFAPETQHPWSARWTPTMVKQSDLQKGSHQWRDQQIKLIKGLAL